MPELRIGLLCVLVACGDTDSGAPREGPADAAGPRADAAADGATPRTLPLPPSGKWLGATPTATGTDFRVWAPNASAVTVDGDFGAQALASEPSGLWFAHVEGARPGHRYQFRITTNGQTRLRMDPRGRQVDGERSVVVDPLAYAWKSKPSAPPPREATVVYELHVGSFYSPDGPEKGTFARVAEKLDYLRDLGVTTIELMPANHFGARAGWGYNPHGYFAPHPTYGTPDDLRRLVDEAHARGMGVVLDVVFNHYDGWDRAPLNCFDGNCDGNRGVYFFKNDPYRMTPWGPRPDFANDAVRDFLLDSVFAWRSEYSIDGFRWDSTSNIRGLDGQGEVPGGAALLRRGNEVARSLEPRPLLIAEDLKGNAAMTTEKGFGFDAQWDGFDWDLRRALVGADDAARDLGAVRNALTNRQNGDPFQRLIYVESHDSAGNRNARLPVLIDGKDPTGLSAKRRAILGAAVLFTAPGVPMIFQGEELLETTHFDDPPKPTNWGLAESNAGIVAFFRDAIRLRRNVDGVSGGLLGPNVDVFHVNDGAKVLAYRRWNRGDDDVVVVANFGGRSFPQYDISLPSAGTWKVRLSTDFRRYSPDFGGTGEGAQIAARPGAPFVGTVALAPYSALVLSR